MSGTCCSSTSLVVRLVDVLVGAGARADADSGALRRAVVMSRRLEVDHERIAALWSHVGAGLAGNGQREQLEPQQ